MSSLKFHLSGESMTFNGKQTPLKEADFIFFGVPFDSTSTYRSGSRFAPDAIRQASINIETFSMRTGIDASDLKIYDSGNMVSKVGVKETLKAIVEVITDCIKMGKIPVMVGGEHTITLGAVEALREGMIIIFDAHMDLRDRYPEDARISHATVSRRICEIVGDENLILLGVRAFSKEEYAYAKEKRIFFRTSEDLSKNLLKTVEDVKEKIKQAEKIWISIDMDVIDPSMAPAVGNPEPEGITTTKLLDTLKHIIDSRVVGFDLVEVSPHYDHGVTAIQAAKIILETCCLLEKIKL